MPVKIGSTTVFRWNHNPDPSKNTLVRTLVGKKYWRETFEQFIKSQRRYDPVRDEFDLCAGLDTESYVEPDDNDYRDFNTDNVQPAHYPDVPEPELIAARSRSLSRGDPGPSSPSSSRRQRTCSAEHHSPPRRPRRSHSPLPRATPSRRPSPGPSAGPPRSCPCSPRRHTRSPSPPFIQ